MKTVTRNLILGISLTTGFLMQVTLASVEPPLETQIVQSTKTLMPGVSTDVKLMVMVPDTGDARVASVKLTLTGRGNADVLGSDEWIINNFTVNEWQEVAASFVLNGFGEGRLHLQAETLDAVGTRLWGRASSVFFLVTDQRVLTSSSSGFELRWQALESEYLKGLLNKSEYGQEKQNLLGGYEPHIERVLRGAPEVKDSFLSANAPVFEKATIEGRATYTHRTGHQKVGEVYIDEFADHADSRGIPGAQVLFFDQPSTGAAVQLVTEPALVFTDADGNYSAVVPGERKDDTAVDLVVEVYSTNMAATIQSPKGGVYYVGKKAGVIDAATMEVNVHSRDNHPVQLGAFAILDCMHASYNHMMDIISRTGIGVPPKGVAVNFPIGDPAKAFFDNNTFQMSVGLDLAHDWDVITHEYGHYIQKKNGTNASVGGDHNVDNLTGHVQSGSGRLLTKDMALKLAWAEGWATYFGTAVQIDSGAGATGIYSVGDTLYTDTGNHFSYGIEKYLGTFKSAGEDSEISVQRILWDFADTLQDEHDTVTFGNDAMWRLLHEDVKPLTLDEFRAKVNDRTPGAGQWYYGTGSQELNRAKYGRIFSDHNVGPEPIQPVDGAKSVAPPTFKWYTKGAGPSPSYSFDKFSVQFWDPDFTREYFTSLEIPTDVGKLSDDGESAEWTPTQEDWDWIIGRGGPLIHWAVAGSHSDGTTITGPYLGLDHAIGAVDVAFVIDTTASMSEEISGVKSALTRYISWLRASPPAVSPLIEVFEFSDWVYLMAVSQDLDVIQDQVNGLFPAAGWDCPEASGEALTAAISDMARGGVIILATDASPHSGYSLDMAKAMARSKGISIFQIITGDCAPEPVIQAATNQMMSGSVPYKRHLGPTTNYSHNPGYLPPAVEDEPVIWWQNVVCPECPVGPGVGPAMSPNILKEVGDSSLPAESALASYMDLATASPNGHFLYIPDVKDGDSEPFVNAIANAVQSASRPTVTMVKPVEGHQGAQVDIEIQGGRTNFNSTSQLTISGPGITINSVTPVSPTSLFANITIGPAANPASRNVRVNTDLGGGQTESAGGTGQFRIVPSIIEPKLVSVLPALLERGKRYALDINGVNTSFSSGSTTVNAGPDLTVNSVSVTGAKSLSVDVSVATDAHLGFHDVEAITGNESAWLLDTLAVVASIGLPPGMPGVISVTPNMAEQFSYNLKLKIRGRDTHFVNGLTSAEIPGSGVTVLSTKVTSPTFAVVEVNIGGAASLGYRDVILRTGGETAVMPAAISIEHGVASEPPPPPPAETPCNDNYVKQATNELVIKVTPNGVDDTVNIQCALDWAADTGMPVVKLSADTFYISSLVIENFSGSLQGITTDSTLIVVLDDSISCMEMADSGRVPAAIKFIKGEPRLRYLTIHADQACKAASRWDPRFLAIVHYTGDAADPTLCTNDVIFGTADRVIIDGTSRVTGPWWSVLVGAESDNFNVCQGRLLGTFKLNRSALANTKYGISSALKSGAQVDINFNSFVGNLSGVWMIDSNQNTTITGNEFYGESTAAEPHFSVMLASSVNAPSATRLVVNNNVFNLDSPSGRNSVGVLTQQPGKVINISNIVTNNRFVLSGNNTWGVLATDVSNTHVSANRFEGTPQGAVLVAGTVPVKGWTITSNTGLKDLVPSSLRDIWLRENTSKCIVGPGQWATVNNFGTGNSVLSTGTQSPTVHMSRVNDGSILRNATGKISPDISEEITDFIQPVIWEGQLPGESVFSGSDSADSSIQATGLPGIRPQAISNPCNSAYVKQASTELVIKVSPNGVDDTENIQCALNWAADTGMPVVKLSADKFHVSSLSVKRFNGSFQGATMDTTTLEILDKSVACVSMSSSGQVSAAIKFIEGEPRLRFMTINADRACLNDLQLETIVQFTGDPADQPDCGSDVIFGTVDRVRINGSEEFTGPLQAIHVGAESDYFHGSCQRKLLGTFKLNRSTLANTQTGIGTSMKSGAQVDVNFNTFTGNRYAIDIYRHHQNMTITANQFIGDAQQSYWGISPNDGYFGIIYSNPPDGPKSSRVVIHNNDFDISALPGLESTGVLAAGAKETRVSGLITNNRFVLNGDSLWGIKSYSSATANTHVSANRFSGAPTGAILVDANDPLTGWTITANIGFKDLASRSLSDISLSTKTSKFIIGPGQGATVNNLGTGNVILSSPVQSPERDRK